MGVGASDVYEFFGVQRAGWQEAREYLRQEILAFARVSMEAPAQVLPGGVTTDELDPAIVVYATTRSPPRPAIDAYYAAVARFQPDYTPISGSSHPAFDVPPSGAVEDSDPFTVRGDRFVDGTLTGMQLLLADVGFDYEPARQILGEALGASREERRSRVRACWYGVGGAQLGSDTIRFDVHGVASSFRVVRGHEGLQCAVRGDVEGAPCDLTDYLVSYGNVTPPGGDTGFADSRVHTIAASALAGSSPIPNTGGRRDGTSATTEGPPLLPRRASRSRQSHLARE